MLNQVQTQKRRQFTNALTDTALSLTTPLAVAGYIPYMYRFNNINYFPSIWNAE